MAKSFEPDPKKFKRTILWSMVFLAMMAVLIIYRKTQKEKEHPVPKAMPY